MVVASPKVEMVVIGTPMGVVYQLNAVLEASPVPALPTAAARACSAATAYAKAHATIAVTAPVTSEKLVSHARPIADAVPSGGIAISTAIAVPEYVQMESAPVRLRYAARKAIIAIVTLWDAVVD